MPLAAKRIMVPVAGPLVDEEAFRLACRMARLNGAKIHVLYVIELGYQYPLDANLEHETGEAETTLQRIEAMSHEERCPVDATVVQARHAGPAIVQEAVERKMELISMSTMGKSSLASNLLGDTTMYVLKNAPCSVLIWRQAVPQVTVRG